MKTQIKAGNPRTAGNMLLVALVIAGVVGLALLSYLSLIGNQQLMTARSQAWNSALPLVEAGIEEAIEHITSSPKQWVANGWQGSGDNIRLERTLGDGYYSVNVTNNAAPVIIARGYVRAPLRSSDYIVRAVRVTLLTKPQIGPGLGAKQAIDMNGNKLTVDSFDSSDPNYSMADGTYTDTKRKDGVTVATNLGVTDALDIGNADIYGKVATGPGGSVGVLKNGIVGSTTWHTDGNKGIETGYASNDAQIPFPPISDPGMGISPPKDASGALLLADEIYEVKDLKGPIVVTGHATLIVRSSFAIAGIDAIQIKDGGKLDLYVYAADATFGPGSYNYLNGGKATNLRYHGMPSNVGISFNGGTTFVGVIYAPEAALQCNGGGDGVNFCGASLTKSVKMNGGYSFHFDEALMKDAETGYIISSWDEI